MAKKILALVSEAIDAETLRSALGGEDIEGAEVLVVAPALNSRRRFILGDPDGAIERAEAVQVETVERLGEGGVDAAGGTGESDPLLALQDALATFEADEIVLFTHSGGKSNFLEEGLVDEATARFTPPVRHMVVE
jgi:GABA permease